MLNSNGIDRSAEKKSSKTRSKKESSAKATSLSSEKSSSKIPVYSFHKRIASQELLKHSDSNCKNKHSLSAYQIAELPEDVKLMHLVHCHCNHQSSNCLPRSKTHEFQNNIVNMPLPSSSLPTTSGSTSGGNTPENRKLSNASTQSSTASKKTRRPLNQQKYEEYLPLCEMQKGLEKGEIVEGILRVNPKNFNESYISAPEGGLDIFIGGLTDRNRALNGDQVAVKLNPLDKWTISISSINSNWHELKSDFEKILPSQGKEESCITLKSLEKVLIGQDLKKIEIAAKGNKLQNLRAIISEEFSNVPIEIFDLKMTELKDFPKSHMFIQRSGKVVNLTNKVHTRIVGGVIQWDSKNVDLKNASFVRLSPSDIRVPHVMIPVKSLPKDYIDNYSQLKDNLFLAKITNWEANSLFPKGEIMESLGQIGNIEAETELVLRSNDIDTTEFPNEALEEYDLFSDESWKIPSKEFEYRRDFRKECVFTIDPQSARDLDDAISLKILPDNLFEIGVHIADVSYFIREDTMLDDIAKRRATSVYLVNTVIPMLPHLFCQNLCSLNSGEDKLTFSVVFTMDGEGKVVDKWIGRTVINSCAKLSYEHAQKMIDSPNEQFNGDEFPEIFGKWSLADIASRVNEVNRLAQIIRKRRFATGSLRLDKTKLGFLLNEDGLPVSFSKYIYKDSNRLIEELMLLANKAIAERIYDCFAQQNRAFLRGHPPPNLYNLNEFVNFCKNSSINFDISNSLSIYNSLQGLSEENPIYFRLCSMNLIKSMKLAVYLCVSAAHGPEKYHHFALNFDKYTHFTSPIRRYADVIVHRLLAASCNYDTKCTTTSKELARIAENCNTRKYNAFVVSERSSEIYLKAYISSIGSLQTKAVVCNVYDHSFDVLILQFDLMNRVYLDKLPLDGFEFDKSNGEPELKLKWRPIANEESGDIDLEQTIRNLLELDVKMSVDGKFNYSLLISHPNGDFIPATEPNESVDEASNA